MRKSLNEQKKSIVVCNLSWWTKTKNKTIEHCFILKRRSKSTHYGREKRRRRRNGKPDYNFIDEIHPNKKKKIYVINLYKGMEQKIESKTKMQENPILLEKFASTDHDGKNVIWSVVEWVMECSDFTSKWTIKYHLIESEWG